MPMIRNASPHQSTCAVRARLVRRLRDEAPGQHPRQDAERDVDVEDPGPGVVVGDPAAQRRSEGRADHDAHAEDRLAGRALLEGEHVEQDGLRGEMSAPPPMPWIDAPADQHLERMGVAAEERRER